MADVETIDAIARAARLSHGALRAAGPRRDRRRLRGLALLPRAQLRRAALAPLAAERADGRGRAPRPQERARLVRVPARARARTRRRRRPAAARGGSWSVAGEARRRPGAARAGRAAPASTRASQDEAERRGAVAADRRAAPIPRGRRCRAARSRCCAPTARCTPSTAAAARWASTCCPRSTRSPLVELTRGDGHRAAGGRARRGVLRRARPAHRVGAATRRGSCSGASSPSSINEACFAVGEGVGSREDVDDGMVLGLNHPRGPFAWCEAIGAEHVLAVLDALRDRARRGALPRGAAAAQAGHVSAGTAPRLTDATAEAFNGRVPTAVPALPRRPPRGRVALPGRLGRPRRGRRLLPGDVPVRDARLSAGCAPRTRAPGC